MSVLNLAMYMLIIATNFRRIFLFICICDVVIIAKLKLYMGPCSLLSNSSQWLSMYCCRIMDAFKDHLQNNYNSDNQ